MTAKPERPSSGSSPTREHARADDVAKLTEKGARPINTATDLPRPEVEDPRQWRFPAVQRTELAGGIACHTYDLPGQHVAAARLVLDLPLDVEPRESEGVAAIMARTMDEGTTEHGAEEFAELIEAQGASYAVDVDYGSMNVQLEVPLSRLDRALELLAEAVSRPAFPEQEVARHVKVRIGQIAQTKANAAARVREDFHRALFAPQSRVARPISGVEETLTSLDRDQVAAFHARHIGPSRATLIVAADLAAVDLDVPAAAERAFGDWRTSAGAAPTMAAPIVGETPRLVVVDRPGSVQTELAVGTTGPDRQHPHWAAHTIAAYILGGTVTSRLDMVLREEKGYTYGMRAQFTPFRRGGAFIASGSVRGEVTGAAVEDILGIMAGARSGFDPAECASARDFLTKLAPLRYETATAVADQAASNVGNDVPVDHVDRNLEAQRAATVEEISAAYAETVDPDALTMVAIGDAETIVPALESLGRGEVEVWTA